MYNENIKAPIAQGEVTNYSKTFYYDHGGRLVREISTDYYTESASETRELVFLYDESSMVGFTYSKNGATPTSYYYQRNLLGDVIGIYTTSGTKVVEYAYDAWGNCTIKNSTTNYNLAHANPIRYRGYYYDEDTKLYYLNARYYSPEWRRFISHDDTYYLDPQNVNGLNLYCYCDNDPVNTRDILFKKKYNILNEGEINGSFTRKAFATLKQNNSHTHNNWINLHPIPSWVDIALDIADLGSSSSIIGLTAWYTLKYPGVAELMKLDGITSIPGRYSDFIESLGYAFVIAETGLDIYSNFQQGQNAGYILTSGAYTLGTGLGITWGSAKIGAYIGTLIGGPVGFVVGGTTSIIIGLALEWLSDKIKEWIL